MKWIEISINTTLEASDAIAELLTSKGASGTEMVDPYAFRQVLDSNEYLDYADAGLIESFGDEVTVKAWFSEDRNVDQLVKEIRSALMDISSYIDTGRCEINTILRDDSEWKDTWKQYFKPFKLTNSIVVKPTWEEYKPQAGEIVLELDPGMAFGTGTHETTRMCAILGEKYIKPGDKVLDLGCGTAILAASAVKLGAGSALAVDIDDAAVKVARENVLKNGLANSIQVMQGELKDIEKEPYDLIFINIIADIILSVSEHVKNYTKPGTKILLSGVIRGRRDEVVDAYTSLGFELKEEMEQGEWVAMVFNA